MANDALPIKQLQRSAPKMLAAKPWISAAYYGFGRSGSAPFDLSPIGIHQIEEGAKIDWIQDNPGERIELECLLRTIGDYDLLVVPNENSLSQDPTERAWYEDVVRKRGVNLVYMDLVEVRRVKGNPRGEWGKRKPPLFPPPKHDRSRGAAELGKVSHMVYGYRKDPCSRSGLARRSELSPIFDFIYDRYLGSHPIKDLVVELNDQAAEGPSAPWTPKMLVACYTGVLVLPIYGGFVVRGMHTNHECEWRKHPVRVAVHPSQWSVVFDESLCQVSPDKYLKATKVRQRRNRRLSEEYFDAMIDKLRGALL